MRNDTIKFGYHFLNEIASHFQLYSCDQVLNVFNISLVYKSLEHFMEVKKFFHSMFVFQENIALEKKISRYRCNQVYYKIKQFFTILQMHHGIIFPLLVYVIL